MPYLVDTDILIDFLRKKPAAAEYLDSIKSWSYSVATAMELYAGTNDKKELREMGQFLERMGESRNHPAVYSFSMKATAIKLDGSILRNLEEFKRPDQNLTSLVRGLLKAESPNPSVEDVSICRAVHRLPERESRGVSGTRRLGIRFIG